jgi:putative transposase
LIAPRSSIDRRSVKTTEAGGPRGYDAGKKINGRKRHVPVDTLGLLLVLVGHAADLQDRDGLALACRRLRRRFPWLRLIFADGGYRGETAAGAAARERLRLQIVRRAPGARGFAVLPSAGWSSAASPSDSGAVGSAATAGWPRTSRRASPPAPR